MQLTSWMLDRGWSIAAEVAGVTARDKAGPQAGPTIAWLRRQPLETTVVLGGRHLGAGASPISVTLNGSPLETFSAPNGYFVRFLTLPAGALDGRGPCRPAAGAPRGRGERGRLAGH